MTTIGDIPLEITSPSDTYLMEIENPGIVSGKITWATILSLTKTFSQADLHPVAFSGAYSALSGLPDLFLGNYEDLLGIPEFADIAFSGSYNDLSDVPEIETGGHTIQDEGVDKPARTKLNFVGSSVAITDSPGTDTTTVTISAGSSWNNGGTETSDFTAIDNTIYYIDPSSSYITVTLPSSGKVKLIDIVGNSPSTGFGERNVTVIPLTGTIMGDANLILDKGGLSIELEKIGTDWRLV